MHDFQDLSIRGTPDKLSNLILNLSECSESNWHRRQELEEKLVGVSPKGNEWYCFSCDETLARRAANLWLSNRSEAELYVCNIVPMSSKELDFNDYNIILNDFEKFVGEHAEACGVEVALTGGVLDIKQHLSSASYSLLQKFSGLANKSTGSSHPLDQKRWFDFLVSAHDEHSRLTSHELYRWLVEEESWPSDIASRLAAEYEKGCALLDYQK